MGLWVICCRLGTIASTWAGLYPHTVRSISFISVSLQASAAAEHEVRRWSKRGRRIVCRSEPVQVRVFDLVNKTHAALAISPVPLQQRSQELMSLPFLSYWCGKRKPPCFPQTYLSQHHNKKCADFFSRCKKRICLIFWQITLTFVPMRCTGCWGLIVCVSSLAPTRPFQGLVLYERKLCCRRSGTCRGGTWRHEAPRRSAVEPVHAHTRIS